MTKSLTEKLKNLPSSPGVYLFKNSAGKVIYIGKGKSLRNRVRTYFQKRAQNYGAADTKTAVMVRQVSDFELYVTDSEIEALILEANLVKEYKPRYNIHLKDDKHYPYVKITLDEPFPRVLIVRRIEKDNARYFGPYTSAASMRKSIRFITKLFKIRTCDLVIPHPQGNAYQVCLDYRIGRCGGPCEDLQSQENYRESIDAVMLFLSGRGQRLITELEKKMYQASENSEYESAAELRDQISDLKKITERQKVDVADKVDRDVIALALGEGEGVSVALQIRDGVLIGRQNFSFKPSEIGGKEEALREFLAQYYSHQPNPPKQIYLPFPIDDEALISEWLSETYGSKVTVISPQRGQKLRLVEMAQANADLLLGELLVQKRGYRERIAPMVKTLQEALSLPKPPNTVCCFDISNTGDTDAVGAMSYFKKGKPLKSEYRHFKIKNVTGQDDYAMMREIVGRYFFRRQKEKKSFPDLVVIDGGRGQLNAAVAELESLQITDQKIIGLAKRLEEIYFPDREQPITLPKTSPALSLLKQVRDESHRFGVSYNRKVRSKRTIKSKLDEIAGIGPAKRTALLKKFGSVKKIREATVEEIAQTPGISHQLAESLREGLVVG
ncbi:excinuclease ABC subunit UvrC [Gemmatimonas aurantiaca]|nr:excinuclease ABC subunit UvrC [Gemmatimonas aurantiaca]